MAKKKKSKDAAASATAGFSPVMASLTLWVSMTAEMDDMLRTLAEMNKPTIARVHGAALGGGMGLASACDICVAGEGAVFATSEVRFGIIPSAISPYVIRAIGARQAGRYFQTAERISAGSSRSLTTRANTSMPTRATCSCTSARTVTASSVAARAAPSTCCASLLAQRCTRA